MRFPSAAKRFTYADLYAYGRGMAFSRSIARWFSGGILIYSVQDGEAFLITAKERYMTGCSTRDD
jgi:hypothetical protein